MFSILTRSLALVLVLAGSARAQPGQAIDGLGGGTGCAGDKVAADLSSAYEVGAVCSCTNCSATDENCVAGTGGPVPCYHQGSNVWKNLMMGATAAPPSVERAFKTILTPGGGTSSVAESVDDILTMLGANGCTVATTAEDQITFSCPTAPAAEFAFKTIHPSTGANVVATTVGDLVNIVGGSGCTVTGNAGAKSITVACPPDGIGFTQEQIEDFVGLMVFGNTETGIDVEYIDNGTGVGKINFVLTYSNLPPTDWDTIVDMPPGFADGVDNTGGGSGLGGCGDCTAEAGDKIDMTAGIFVLPQAGICVPPCTPEGSTCYEQSTDRFCVCDASGAFDCGPNAEFAFKTIHPSTGANVVASTVADTVNMLAGAGCTVTGDAAAKSITIACPPDGTGFTREEIEDYVGLMVSTNTETGIDVQYQDNGTGFGKFSFVVTAPAWSAITGMPPGFADGTDDLGDDWNDLTNIPPGFADGTDDGTGSGTGDCVACEDQTAEPGDSIDMTDGEFILPEGPCTGSCSPDNATCADAGVLCVCDGGAWVCGSTGPGGDSCAPDDPACQGTDVIFSKVTIENCLQVAGHCVPYVVPQNFNVIPEPISGCAGIAFQGDKPRARCAGEQQKTLAYECTSSDCSSHNCVLVNGACTNYSGPGPTPPPEEHCIAINDGCSLAIEADDSITDTPIVLPGSPAPAPSIPRQIEVDSDGDGTHETLLAVGQADGGTDYYYPGDPADLVIDAPDELPACPTPGHIYKSSGGEMVCSTDLDSGTAVGEPNTLYVCWDGVNIPPSGGGGSIAQPLRTVQYAINRVTEEGDTSLWAIALCSGTWPSGYGEAWPIKTFNTDPASPVYLKQARGLRLRGAGTVLSSDGITLDVSGATTFSVNDVSLNGFVSVYSRGGTSLSDFRTVGLNGVGQFPRLWMLGQGNNANFFGDNSNYFTSTGTFGSAIIYEIGSGPAGEGICKGAAISVGGCNVDADCGGICGSTSSPSYRIGMFCTTTADCGGGTCAMTPQCSHESLDMMQINTFHQSAGLNFAQLLPRACSGGSTTPAAPTVAIDHDDTCTAAGNTQCASLTGVACITDADCQRAVKGTSTAFTTNVIPGDRITIGAKTLTVFKVLSNTVMYMTDEWANSTGTSYAISNDGVACSSNASCDTGGTCAVGTGTTFEEHFNNAVMLSGGAAGLCGDGANAVAFPRQDCSVEKNYCEDTTACTADTDCASGQHCNRLKGKCKTYTPCTATGDCTGTSGCTGGEVCTCPDECNAGGCVNASVYVEGAGNTIRLRDATLTTTVNVETTTDYPAHQVWASGGTVKISGGNIDVGGSHLIDDELYRVNGGTIDGEAILIGKYLSASSGVRMGNGTDTGDFCLTADDDVTGTRKFCWNNTTETWDLDTGDASPSAIGVRILSNGTIKGSIVDASSTFGGFAALGLRSPGGLGLVALLKSDNTSMFQCSESTGGCTAVNAFTASSTITEGSSGTARKLSGYRSEVLIMENLGAGDDNWPLWIAPPASVTVREVSCRCEGTCSSLPTIVLEDAAGNAMTGSPTCVTGSTAATWASVTAGGGLTTGEGMRMDVTGTSPNGTDDFMIGWRWTLD